MTKKRTRNSRPRKYDLAVPFAQEVRQLPAGQRPGLLAQFRRRRLWGAGGGRTFWLIDEVGRRQRL